MTRVYTRGFGTLLDMVGDSDNDTWVALQCRFTDARTVYRSRSTQSVLNTLLQCSIGGATEAVFDVRGNGHTDLIDCNVVIDGTVLLLNGFTNDSDMGPNHSLRLINCRQENHNGAGNPGGSRSGIVRLGSNPEGCRYSVDFDGYSFVVTTIGGNLDPAYAQIEAVPGLSLRFRGGAIDYRARVRLYQKDVYNPFAARTVAGVSFRDMAQAPLVSNIIHVPGAGTSTITVNGAPQTLTHANGTYPPLTYRLCSPRAGQEALPDLCIPGPNTALNNTAARVDGNMQQVMVPSDDTPRPLIYSGAGTTVLRLPFGGYLQRIERVQLRLQAKTGGALTVKIYKDAAMTAGNLLHTISLTSADNASFPPPMVASGCNDALTGDGLFAAVTGDAAHYGVPLVTHRPAGH